MNDCPVGRECNYPLVGYGCEFSHLCMKERNQLMPIDQDELDRRYHHHPPNDQGVIDRHIEIRRACMNLAYIIGQLVPEGRERSLALTHTEEVMMWANAGIARNQ